MTDTHRIPHHQEEMARRTARIKRGVCPMCNKKLKLLAPMGCIGECRKCWSKFDVGPQERKV